MSPAISGMCAPRRWTRTMYSSAERAGALPARTTSAMAHGTTATRSPWRWRFAARTRRMMFGKGYPDYAATSVEPIGCEALYGPNARLLATREVLLRLAARHPAAEALQFLQRECASAGSPTGAGTRPAPV